MRPASIVLISLLFSTSCAAPRLARSDAQQKIAALGPSRLITDAVEIRRIDPQSENMAVVDSAVTLAFQFKRESRNAQWEVAAIRFGDPFCAIRGKFGCAIYGSDWINMPEILGAIPSGPPPKSPSNAGSVDRVTELAGELNGLLPSDRGISELDEERKRIAELSQSKLVPNAITIRRIISQTENQAIAESTVALTFQFKRNGLGGSWYPSTVRLGERSWIDISNLLAALNEGRRHETTASLNALVAGIETYRRANGSIPKARNISDLTDVLHPQYMTDLVRVDAWGRPLDYSVTGSTFHVASRGQDGIAGTSDDIVVAGNVVKAP